MCSQYSILNMAPETSSTNNTSIEIVAISKNEKFVTILKNVMKEKFEWNTVK